VTTRQQDRRRKNTLRSGTVFLCIAFEQAAAQWTAVSLHAPGYSDSRVLGGTGTPGLPFGGVVRTGGPGAEAFPVIWDTQSLSPTFLPLPVGISGAEVVAVSSNQQVGDGAAHALLWNGPGSIPVDLNPSVALTSRAYGVASGIQVGYAAINGDEHAALWNGSAESFIDLTPPGSRRAVIRGTTGQTHAGWTSVGTGANETNHAAIWTGTSGAWVDLNPPTANYSEINGMSATHQVGWARVPTPQGFRDHAGFWSGSSGSWIDLHPTAGGSSIAWAAYGSVQVGVVSNSATVYSHAVIWFGSAGSMVDLHPFLPAGYLASVASSVTEIDGRLIVAGNVTRDPFNSATEAFVWTFVPTPSAAVAFTLGAVVLTRRRR